MSELFHSLRVAEPRHHRPNPASQLQPGQASQELEHPALSQTDTTQPEISSVVVQAR